jgi:RHS repeat-associated protein
VSLLEFGGRTKRTHSVDRTPFFRKTNAENYDSAYAYTYDAGNRLTEIDNDGTPDLPRVILSNGYDNLGRRTSLAAEVDATDDFLNTYAYDALSRMTQVTQAGKYGGNTVAEKRVDLAYNAAGAFSTITRYADLAGTDLVATTTYGYDNALRLTSLTHAHGSTTLAAYTWTYNDTGRLTGVSSGDGTSTFTYDTSGQLTGADHSYQTDETYEYDDNGNRINDDYEVGTNNRLTTDGTYDYEYDDEGNRTKKTDIASGDYVTYTWDHRNRLTDVKFFDDQDTLLKHVHYTYDVFNRLIRKQVDDDGDQSYDRGASYVYDGDDTLFAFDETGSLTNRFLSGPVIDQVFADENAVNDILWSLADNQGTIRDVAEYDAGLDETTVVNHIKYDSFGRITAESDPSKTPLFAYTGRVWDEDAGLYYYRARWYDAATARFLSEDPLSFAAGDVNVSRYVFNSPTNFTDPSGMQINLPPGNYLYDPAARAENEALNRAVAQSTPVVNVGLGERIGNVFSGLWNDAGIMAQNPWETWKGYRNGINTGNKALINAGADAIGSTISLGFWDPPDLVTVTQADIHGGYGFAKGSAGIGINILIGVASGGAGCILSRGGTIARAGGYIIKGMDLASDAVTIAKTIKDIQENEMNWSNGAQLAASVLGMGANLLSKCFVAGTQVVVGVESPPLVVTDTADAAGGFSGLRPWELAMIGVVGMVAIKPRRRGRVSESGDGMSLREQDQLWRSLVEDRSTAAADESQGHPAVCSQLTFDESASDAAPCVSDELLRAHSSASAVTADAAPTEGRGMAFDDHQKSDVAVPAGTSRWQSLRSRFAWGWLAACLLLAAGFGLRGSAPSGGETVAASVGRGSIPVRYITKNIEDLKVGDQVLAWDERTGRQSFQPIDRTYRRTTDHLRILTIRSGDGTEQTLRTTDEHPFWVPGRGWVNAGSLEPGANLLQANGIAATLVGTESELHPERLPVFNVRVESAHTYFAAASGAIPPVLVHNANYVDSPTKLPAAQHTPYQVHIDPRTGRGPMAIDTSTFTSGEVTLNGGIRNPRQFWHQWSGTYGDTLSPANQTAVRARRSPVVDDPWIEHFPEHAPYKGETLIHHHLDYGRQAIPLPETVHGQRPGWGIWHMLHAGES